MNRLAGISVILWLAFPAGWSAPAAAQEIEAWVDQEEVVRGETVELTIRVHGRQRNIDVDVDPLREDFEIISSSSSSQMRSVNNRVQAWTDYNLTLFPRRLGEQEIPSLEIAGESTPRLTINVLENVADSDEQRDLYLETTLNKNRVHVQEQVLFTIRLFYTISGIRNPDFTDLEFDNAVVEQLGPANQYERLVDGVRYGVYELNYVIFPQRSGELEIPDILFRGQLPSGSGGFSFRTSNFSPVTAFAEGNTVQVRERPEAYPADTTFLPSSEISISESWSQDMTTLEAGDSVERTVEIRAFGLDGAALPPIPLPEIDGMNAYEGETEIDRTLVDGNVVGTRSQTYTLVATEPGSAVIPPVEIPWWHTEAGELRQARLDEMLVNINAAPGSEGSSAPQGDAAPDDARSLNDSSLPRDDLLGTPSTPPWILGLVALVLGAGAMMLLYLLRRAAARAPATAGPPPATTPVYHRDVERNQEKAAFRDLEKLCRDGDERQLRMAVIAWARQFFQDEKLHSLDQLAARSDEEAFRESCHLLQASLYAADGGDGFPRERRNALLAQVSDWRSRSNRQQGRRDKDRHYALPPLYNT